MAEEVSREKAGEGGAELEEPAAGSGSGGRTRGRKQLCVVADEVSSLHAKFTWAKTPAEQQRRIAEEGARPSQEEVARLQEQLPIGTAKADTQVRCMCRMARQAKLCSLQSSDCWHERCKRGLVA